MTDPQIGQVLALLSATSFAATNVFVARTKESAGDKGVMFSVLVTLVISAVLWLAAEGGTAVFPRTPHEWSALGWFALAGILAMVFGRSLVFASIRRLGVTRATAVKRLNPFFTALFAALFLGEVLSGSDLIGMAAIAAAFGLLIRESFLARGTLSVAAPPPSSYLFGVFGAVAYAGTYITRKLGLDILHAPAFGTLVSAASGFAGFAILAIVLPRQRAHLAGIFAHLDRWIVLGAIAVSAGQILMFAALSYERVSTVAMIVSLEIFISIFLSVVVFRAERAPGPGVALAAVLATLGVVLVAG